MKNFKQYHDFDEKFSIEPLPDWLYEEVDDPEYTEADINKYLAVGKKHYNTLKVVFDNAVTILSALNDHVLVINPGQMSLRKLSGQGKPSREVLYGKQYSIGLWKDKKQKNNHLWTWNIDIKNGKLPEPAFLDNIGKKDWQDPVVGRLLLAYLLATFKPKSKKLHFNYTSNTSNLQAENKAANDIDGLIMQAVIDNKGKGITVNINGKKFENVTGVIQLDHGKKRGRYGKEEKADFVLYKGDRSLPEEKRIANAVCFISYKALNYGYWYTGSALFNSGFRSEIKEVDIMMKKLDQLYVDLGEPDDYKGKELGNWAVPVKDKNLITMLAYGKDYKSKKFGLNFVNVLALGDYKLTGDKGVYKLTFQRQYVYPEKPSGPDELYWLVVKAHPRAPAFMRAGPLTLTIVPKNVQGVIKSKPF